jgi:hypothetical protein
MVQGKFFLTETDLKDHCRTIYSVAATLLQAQFATGGHFVWDITIKLFGVL